MSRKSREQTLEHRYPFRLRTHDRYVRDIELHVVDRISHETFHVCCDTLSALDEFTNWTHGIRWIGIRGYCLCVRESRSESRGVFGRQTSRHALEKLSFESCCDDLHHNPSVRYVLRLWYGKVRCCLVCKRTTREHIKHQLSNTDTDSRHGMRVIKSFSLPTQVVL